MNIDEFQLDESALEEAAKKREQKLQEDEVEIKATNECEGGGCIL